jgi:hypothetical protein
MPETLRSPDTLRTPDLTVIDRPDAAAAISPVPDDFETIRARVENEWAALLAALPRLPHPCLDATSEHAKRATGRAFRDFALGWRTTRGIDRNVRRRASTNRGRLKIDRR